MPRIITLFGSIDSETFKGDLKQIVEWNQEDDEQAAKLKNFEREPIQFYINSYGGEVCQAMAMIDIILNSRTPVNTYCYGAAFSAALDLYLAGSKRYAGEHCRFMYHSAQGCTPYGMPELSISAGAEHQAMEEMRVKFILQQSKIKEDQLRKSRLNQNCWFFGAEEALKLGVCHEILQGRIIKAKKGKRK